MCHDSCISLQPIPEKMSLEIEIFIAMEIRIQNGYHRSLLKSSLEKSFMDSDFHSNDQFESRLFRIGLSHESRDSRMLGLMS
jgi:hypothetical protein